MSRMTDKEVQGLAWAVMGGMWTIVYITLLFFVADINIYERGFGLAMYMGICTWGSLVVGFVIYEKLVK